MTSLEELLLQWEEGTLNQAGLRQLNERLASPEVRSRLHHELTFQESLLEALRASQACANASEQARAYETLELHTDFTRPKTASPWAAALQAWHSLRQHLSWPVLLPASLAIVVLLILLRPTPPASTAFARLDSAPNGTSIQRNGLTLSPSASIDLKPGDLLIAPPDAPLICRFLGEDTRIQLEPRSQLQLDRTEEGKLLQLRNGTITAEVATQPPSQPLRIETPVAIAAVLGTEFTLTVQSNSTRLEVLEGAVRFTRREDERSLTVYAGQCAVATPETPELAARRLLPEPWDSQDIGFPGRSGHAKWEGKRCHITSGSNSHRGREPLHFVYQTLEGDGEIRARVLAFASQDQRITAGVMIRESLKRVAPTAFLRVNAGRGLEFVRRGPEAETKTELGGAESFPYWIRLVRQGATITAYKSTDGTEWTRTASESFAMGPRIFIGLGVTSSERSDLNTVVFDNINVIATPPPSL